MKKDFIIFLEEQKSACDNREAELIREERKDEANICRIEGNIYDIFKILFQTAVKENKGGSIQDIQHSFEEKAERIPQNWRVSFEKAKEHGDAGKLLIEETKLKAVDRIRKTYEEMKQGEAE